MTLHLAHISTVRQEQDCKETLTHTQMKMRTYTQSNDTPLIGFSSAFCQYSPFTATTTLIRYKGYNNISLLMYRAATNTISIKYLRVIRTKNLTELAWEGA